MLLILDSDQITRHAVGAAEQDHKHSTQLEKAPDRGGTEDNFIIYQNRWEQQSSKQMGAFLFLHSISPWIIAGRQISTKYYRA